MAANKTTAVHFSLIIFVMLFIISSAVAYMFYDDGRDLRLQLEEARSDQNAQKSAAQNYNEQLTALKAKIGHEYPEVGVGDPSQPNTVLHAMTEDIARFSLTNPPDYKTALREIRDELETTKASLAQQQATVKQLNDTIATLRSSYDDQIKTLTADRDAAVQAKNEAENEHNNSLKLVRDQRDAERQEHQQTKVAMQQQKDAHDEAIREKDERITALVGINNVLQERIKNANQETFERPDGLVQWVDNTSHLVWINLGSADNLPKQTNFSVYRKGNRGVGRDSTSTLKGPEDLKGAIEVTRILGPHLAEARILDEDYFEPIGIGDVIYTPIWGANQTTAFAFVGLIDIDHDGQSDRDYLHDVLKAANATIQVEIDDLGNRVGGEINERTKFLVVGDLPNLEELVDKEEKDAAVKIHKAHHDMLQKAREQGVRVVTMNDFLAFMGVKPKQRVFRPGDQRPFNLTHGTRSTPTTETTGGNVSGLYSRSKRLQTPTGGR